MKKFCKYVTTYFVLFALLFSYQNSAVGSEGFFKIFAEITPLYSFTNVLDYVAISQKGDTILFRTRGKRSGISNIYIANSAGFGIKQVFSPGNFKIGLNEIYLDNIDLNPIISGNGNKVAIGLRAPREVEKKTDYMLVYDIQKQSYSIFPLRILVAGCNYARLPTFKNSRSIYSMDFEGNKIVIQVEYGFQSVHCSQYDTGLTLMNTDGSNQQNLIGPDEFIQSNCSFYWKNYPKSPHQPSLSFNGEKVIFYGQAFEVKDPYERNGELFVINSDRGNLRQLTFSKRFDQKPEKLGDYKLNYYGSRIFFKQSLNNINYVASVGLDGNISQMHFQASPDLNFIVSGDGRKIYFIDPLLSNSLVYFDLAKESKIIVIDRTWSGINNNYGFLLNCDNESLYSSNLTNFDGNFLILPLKNEWVYALKLESNLITPQNLILELKIGSVTAKIGIQWITLSSAPYIKEGRIMVPAKLLAETFGIKYVWSPKDQSLQFKLNGNNLTVFVGKKYHNFNGKRINSAYAPEINSNQVYIPAKWANDYFNLTLVWTSTNQKLLIKRFEKE